MVVMILAPIGLAICVVGMAAVLGGLAWSLHGEGFRQIFGFVLLVKLIMLGFAALFGLVLLGQVRL
jgi:hypothetical protein